MRNALLALAALATIVTALPSPADAQVDPRSGRQRQQDGRGQNADGTDPNERNRAPRIAPLRRRAAAGPCPYVKILYDAARFVELTDNRAASANVGFTGEIEGVVADCGYQGDEPITLEMNLLFNLGRGPQAAGDQRTYRYWVAVTERNRAVLAKEYFDLPVDFDGAATASVTEERTIVIPRASATVGGANFEVLVGFDVTPEMAEFNRSGSRFRMTAGQPQAAPTPQ
jgi:hypothetical protein